MNSGKQTFTERFCIEVAPLPATLIIFGASGDLAMRKLLPALFALHQRDLLHTGSKIIGCARTAHDTDSFCEKVRKAVGTDENESLKTFLERFSYVQLDYGSPADFERLHAHVCVLETAGHLPGNRLFYLALPPALYENVTANLSGANLTTFIEGENAPYRNVILEKPFGTNLSSAQKLCQALNKTLREEQIYRIDHYLGKETVQNIFMLRFANTVFEPLLCSKYVQSVHITGFEEQGIGNRAGYYEKAGCIRDMFQNHLFAMMAHLCMEIPERFAPEEIRHRRAELLRCVRPWQHDRLDTDFCRAQYESYRSEPGVAADSHTETYAACRVFIDNDRWRGTPFILQSGKKLSERSAALTLYFKPPERDLFAPLKASDLEPNALCISLQPKEGVTLSIQAKKAGPKRCVGTLALDYVPPTPDQTPLDAYERLLLDAMLNDQTLFLRSDSIDICWQLLDPVIAHFEAHPETLSFYPDGAAPETLPSPADV